LPDGGSSPRIESIALTRSKLEPSTIMSSSSTPTV
jgi:hypothetical protein